MPESPTAPNPTARNPIRARASPMPASAKARRRAAMAMRRRPRFNRDDRAGGGEKRAAIQRPRRRETVRAAIAAMPVRRRVFPTGNSATRSPIRRARVAARSGPIRRVATGRRAIVPTARGRRATATALAATVPSENSAATRSFLRAARRIVARARTLAAARTAAPDRGESKPWQKRDASSPDHAGRNSRPPRDGARNFDKPRFDKPRDDRPAG